MQVLQFSLISDSRGYYCGSVSCSTSSHDNIGMADWFQQCKCFICLFTSFVIVTQEIRSTELSSEIAQVLHGYKQVCSLTFLVLWVILNLKTFCIYRIPYKWIDLTYNVFCADAISIQLMGTIFWSLGWHTAWKVGENVCSLRMAFSLLGLLFIRRHRLRKSCATCPTYGYRTLGCSWFIQVRLSRQEFVNSEGVEICPSLQALDSMWFAILLKLTLIL